MLFSQQKVQIGKIGFADAIGTIRLKTTNWTLVEVGQ